MTRDLPRAIVTYDALLSDWQGVITSLSAGLGISWPRRSAATEIEIERFLATKLRHHVGDPRSLTARAEIVDWVKDTYTALVQLSRCQNIGRARCGSIASERNSTRRPRYSASRWPKPSETSLSATRKAPSFGRAPVPSSSAWPLCPRWKMPREALRRARFRRCRTCRGTAVRGSSPRARFRRCRTRCGTAVRGEALRRARFPVRTCRGTAVRGKLSAELDSAGAALAAEREIAAEQAARLAAIERDHALAQTGHAEAVEDTRRSRAERDALKEALEHAHRTLSAERQRAAERSDQLAELARERERAEASRGRRLRRMCASFVPSSVPGANCSRAVRDDRTVPGGPGPRGAGKRGTRASRRGTRAVACAGGRRAADGGVERLRARGRGLPIDQRKFGLASQLELRTARTARLEADMRP